MEDWSTFMPKMFLTVSKPFLWMFLGFCCRPQNLASFIERRNVVLGGDSYKELRPRDLFIKKITTGEPPVETAPMGSTPAAGESTPTDEISPIRSTSTVVIITSAETRPSTKELTTEPLTSSPPPTTVPPTTTSPPTTAKPVCIPPDKHPQEQSDVLSFAMDKYSYARYNITSKSVVAKLIGTR